MDHTRIFKFIRTVQGQPPVVWEQGDRLIVDPGEPNPLCVNGNQVGWTDQAGGWMFEIGTDVVEVFGREVETYIIQRAVKKLTAEELRVLEAKISPVNEPGPPS